MIYIVISKQNLSNTYLFFFRYESRLIKWTDTTFKQLDRAGPYGLKI